jgi:hypothetical protein
MVFSTLCLASPRGSANLPRRVTIRRNRSSAAGCPTLLAIALGCLVAPGCDRDAVANDDDTADFVDPTPDGFDGAEGREQPLSVQLHLHGSLSEFDGTMACHTEQAEAYGVDVLWWSDHDNMIAMVQRTGGFDFDEGALVEEIAPIDLAFNHGFYEKDVTLDDLTSELHEGGPAGTGWFWRLRGSDTAADGTWSHARYAYTSEIGSAHQMPLMADSTATMQIRAGQAVSPDWQFLFTAFLSSTCTGEANEVTWYLGGDDLSASTTATRLYLPLSLPWPDLWTELELPLTAVAEHFAEEDDQCAQGYQLQVRARHGAEVEFDVDDLAFTWQREGEDLRQYQRDVLTERYSAGSVSHFVGQEITLVDLGQHVNAVGAGQVPLLDYTVTGTVTAAEATTHVRDHGSLAMCNHPFGTDLGLLWEGEDADLQTELTVEAWHAADAFGCDLVEVGYPRRGVDLEHHLLFWDRLALEGHTMVGLGTNDHHWASDWLEHANPFVSWVFLDVPDRAGIADQLGRGRVFFGDPGPFVGERPLLDLWSEHGAVMGETLSSDLDQVLHVQTGHVEGGWSLELVVDGEVTDSVLLAGHEDDTVFVLPRGDVRLVRAQIVDEDGAPILLTNPIYLERPEQSP